MDRDVTETSCEISIVIVSWNVQEYLCQCLTVLKTQLNQYLNYEVIVVDNASTDGTVATIEQEFPEAKLIQNKQNFGFAKANNQALIISRGKFILLLNPDTIVQNGSIESLLDFLRTHNEVGMVGPQLLNSDGTSQASGLNFPALTNNLLGFLRIRKNVTGAYLINANEPVRVNALVGACLLVKKEVIDQVGGFDEDYFMYEEEADWCYRIGKATWTIYYVPSAKVVHFGGQSSKHVPAQMYIALRRSRVIFLLKHRSRFDAILLSAGYALNSCVKILLGDKNNRQTFYQAAIEFLSKTFFLLTKNAKH